ncbi:melanocortin-2 receptor accessory protein [Stigmatopora argus]
MENSSFAGWEYYYGYVDPVVVDASKLKYHKYSVVIIFWITLAAFVGMLFFILNLMSSGGGGRSSWRRSQRRSQRRHTSSTLI